MSKKNCYIPESFLFYTIGHLMKEPILDPDAEAEIVKECVDKLNETVSDFFFGEREEEFQKHDLGSLMSATLFTFFMIGLKKMNAGVRKSHQPGDYYKFIREKINFHLDRLIEEEQNAKED